MLTQSSHTFLKPTSKPKTKKGKTQNGNTKYDIENTLAPAGQHINDAEDRYPLNYSQLKNFLEPTHSSSNPLNDSKQFTDKPEPLIMVLKEIQGLLTDINLKNRVSRIHRKMKKKTKQRRFLLRLQFHRRRGIRRIYLINNIDPSSSTS